MENKGQTHSTESKKILKKLKVLENIILLVVFLFIAYSLDNYFFTIPVIVSVLKGTALISVLAMAESIVLAAGGIDLSIASIGLYLPASCFLCGSRINSGRP